MSARVVVVPCFNEEHRLSRPGVAELAAGARVLLVDSGSTDGTRALCDELAAEHETVDVLVLPRNAGKAEAVRQGITRALSGGADAVAYFDADFATPADEMLRLLDLLDARPELDVVLASRVALLGRTIDRRAYRHYLGRVFATVASLALALPVYDTQCGAKAFRRTPALARAVAAPFTTTWAFDVEFLGRLLEDTDPAAIHEEPLWRWADVGGSHLRPAGMITGFLEVSRLGVRLHRARAARTSSSA